MRSFLTLHKTPSPTSRDKLAGLKSHCWNMNRKMSAFWNCCHKGFSIKALSRTRKNSKGSPVRSHQVNPWGNQTKLKLLRNKSASNIFRTIQHLSGKIPPSWALTELLFSCHLYEIRRLIRTFVYMFLLYTNIYLLVKTKCLFFPVVALYSF